MPRSLLPLLMALTLGACAAPAKPGCDRAVARELATLATLIDETEANLDNGYRVERAPARSGFNLCLGSARSHVGISFCTEPASRTQTVAIDPEAEARKLAALRERRAALLAAHPTCGAPE
ncbi:hypothetical protein [Defluviimonas sp. WL0075]|uniref:Secreted protein n=1 Tax=Albidovulum sediminicola TaxID=2984331 RepID=A0ABT2YX66_9RHOB|nr:hypothetical protein [Defluviimonas sp. WL0075]MCV2863464.1 hypothetical protein [Defluviimonas sp. WL0075]